MRERKCSCKESEEARKKSLAAGRPFAWACPAHAEEPVFWAGGRNSVRCVTCGWKRRVPMRNGGTPFTSAHFFHTFEKGAGHTTETVVEDGEEPVDLRPEELEVGDAYWAGVDYGFKHAVERAMAAVKAVGEGR